MPSQSHPQAQFVPISPDLDLDALVENTENFKYVTKIPHEVLKEHTVQSLEQLVLLYVVKGGQPLVIEGWNHTELPSWLFSTDWLQGNLGTKPENVRDLSNGTDIPMTMGHYLRSLDKLANQITAANYRDPQRQRLYLKDADTPDEWADHLRELLPENIFYLNDCVESRTGGDGAIREPNEYGQMRFGKGAAPAGDLMSSLPQEMRALNMMCYIGHEGTYTPAHREMCASLGQNIMVETSTKKHGEKPGNSIWFMTETKEREVVSEYFLSMLGHDIEVEKHFAQINAWKKAPFTVYIVEQKAGDLILIPPLAPHQVWNRGTRTMKAAWNRTTVETLELAIHEALPRARMVCRDEQYKNKAIIYYTLLKYYDLLQRDTIEPKMWKYGRIKQLIDDFRKLFALFSEIIFSEMFSPSLPKPKDLEFLPFDSNVTCSYCRCNIYNRFLTCKSCIEIDPSGEEDTYDICMECYVMGRSCACISNLTWVEQWKWSELTGNYENWRGIVVRADEYYDINTSPPPLDILKERYGKKTVAGICQEQLKSRPWHDITKPVLPEPFPGDSDVEPEVDDEGRLKKKASFKRGKGKVLPVKNKTHPCHICQHHDYNWKLAFCTTCTSAYCYGVLWRAFDLMPQTVMENANWECPKCLKICSCGKCRKTPTQTPYAPKGTLLGHDTRKVADFRSIESLVDFSKPNLGWLRDEETNPKDSARMKKLKERAAAEKARTHTVEEGLFVNGSDQLRLHDTFQSEQLSGTTKAMGDIDPQLRPLDSPTDFGNSNYNEFYAPPDSPTNNDFALPNGVDDGLNNYPRDDLDSQNQLGGTIYPSRLLGPMANMYTSEAPFPDSPYFGHDRMMGIGYYQQDNGSDKILYDDPSGAEVQVNPPIPAIKNPNMAFSDLLDPRLQSTDAKKRKRHGEDGDESEEEFFASKKQKKLAAAKKIHRDDHSVDGGKPRGPGRPPRRTTEKIHSYIDPNDDVDIAPGQEVEALAVTNPAVDGNNDDDFDHVTLAAKAISRLSKAPAKEKSSSRGALSDRNCLADQSKSPAVNSSTAKRGRKPGRPARREALGSGEDYSVGLPDARRRRLRASLENGHAASKRTFTVISSNLSCDDSSAISLSERDDDHMGRVPRGSRKNASEKSIGWRASDTFVGVELGEQHEDMKKEEEEAETAPRKRGRPRKNPQPPIEQTRGSPQSTARPLSPDTVKPSSVRRFLSLKERLALKGKSAKIVAKSQKAQAISPGPMTDQSNAERPSASSSTRNTPSTIVKDARRVSLAVRSPNANGHFVDQADADSEHIASSPAASPQANTMAAPASPVEPVRKGPTVVRLMSPSDESESVQSERSKSYASSDDDDDSSIPAIKLEPTHDGLSLRGRAASNGASPRGGRGMGRPRGRRSLR